MLLFFRFICFIFCLSTTFISITFFSNITINLPWRLFLLRFSNENVEILIKSELEWHDHEFDFSKTSEQVKGSIWESKGSSNIEMRACRPSELHHVSEAEVQWLQINPTFTGSSKTFFNSKATSNTNWCLRESLRNKTGVYVFMFKNQLEFTCVNSCTENLSSVKSCRWLGEPTYWLDPGFCLALMRFSDWSQC